jgi:hypothetical protein
VSDTYADRYTAAGYSMLITRGPASKHTRVRQEQKQQDKAAKLEYPVLTAELTERRVQIKEMASGSEVLTVDLPTTSVSTRESAKLVLDACVQESGLAEFKVVIMADGVTGAVLATYPERSGILGNAFSSGNQSEFHPLLDLLDVLLCFPCVCNSCCAKSATNRAESAALRSTDSAGVVLAEQMVREAGVGTAVVV